MPKYFSLSSVTGRIRDILDEASRRTFWVKATASSGSVSKGHMYGDLAERNAAGQAVARMRFVIWSANLGRIQQKFRKAGLEFRVDQGDRQVAFKVRVDFNKVHGLSLLVEDADVSMALGEMERQRRQIIEKLTKEGLIHNNRKRFLCVLPSRVGLITAPGKAAGADFKKTLIDSGFGFHIFEASAAMQGDLVEREVLKGIQCLIRLRCEVIVITRGGGSKTDLFWLDNEAIARAITDCPLPVFTAIGHETDRGVLDEVAHTSCRTPTFAARELVSRFQHVEQNTSEGLTRIQSNWTMRLNWEKTRLTENRVGLINSTRKLFRQTSTDLWNQAMALRDSARSRVSGEQRSLTHMSECCRGAAAQRISQENGQISQWKAELEQSTKGRLRLERVVLHRQIVGWRQERFQQLIDARKKWINQSFLKSIEKLNLRVTGFRQRFQQIGSDVHRAVGERLSAQETHLHAGAQKIAWKGSTRLDVLAREFSQAVSRFRMERVLQRLSLEARELDANSATLRAIDPQRNLERGYAIVFLEGRLLKDVKQVEPDDAITIRIANGEILADVKGKKKYV